MDEIDDYEETDSISGFLDYLSINEPMKWQSIVCDLEVNTISLRMMNEWTSMEWYEKELNREEYPELSFLSDEGDDSLIMEMKHELLACLN